MLLFFLLLLILLVKPCLPTSTACYNKGSETIKIGTKSSICLIILPLNWTSSGELIQLLGSFTVDVLSSFSVPGSWSSVVYKNDTLMQKLSISDKQRQGTGVGVIVATAGILSYQRAYRLTRAPPQTPAPTARPTTPMPQANLTSRSMIELNVKKSEKDIASTIGQESGVQIDSVSTSSSSSSATTPLNGITFPLLMVIVNVNKGVVQSVVWDDTCSWCGKNQCAGNTLSLTYPHKAVSEGNNCFVNDDTCSAGTPSTKKQQTKAPTPSPLPPSLSPSLSHTLGENVAISTTPSAAPSTATTAPTAISTTTPSISPTAANHDVTSTKLCELKVYITWTGTDVNGASLQSSAKRFSRLSNVQLTSFTASQQNTVSAV